MGTVTQHHWLGKLKFIQHFCQADNVITLFIPTHSHNMLALLCVSSLALAAGHKLDGAKFGSKSSYFTVANQDTSSLEVRDIDNVTEAEAIRLRVSQVGTDM